MFLKCLFIFNSQFVILSSQMQITYPHNIDISLNESLDFIRFKNILQLPLNLTTKYKLKANLNLEFNQPIFDFNSKTDSLGFDFEAEVENSTNNKAEEDIYFDWRSREEAFKITKPEEHPYAVFLLLFVPEGEIITCSGSLLTFQFVLTAGHCVHNAGHAWVYAGGNSMSEIFDFDSKSVMKEDVPQGSQLLKSKKLILHPGYPKSVDLALIKVHGEFISSSSVKTIRLSTEEWKTLGYRSCVTTGFGTVFTHEIRVEDHLRKTHELEVKQPCLCNFLLSLEELLSSTNILCSKPRKDYGVCKGDSGGGLVCDGEIHAVNMAVYAFDDVTYCDSSVWPRKIECGEEDSLSLFQTTQRHLSWINKCMEQLSGRVISENSDNMTKDSSSKEFNVLTIILFFALLSFLTYTLVL